MTGDV